MNLKNKYKFEEKFNIKMENNYKNVKRSCNKNIKK